MQMITEQPMIQAPVEQADTIFIQIASYRDPELLSTMHDAVEKAKYPDNLSFGICFQEHTDSPDYKALKAFPRCRVIQVDPEHSGGACQARAATQSLWQDETYTLQIDSHMRFVPEWDSLLLEMFAPLGEKAILTCYCPAYHPDKPLPRPVAYNLGADTFSESGSLLFCSRSKSNVRERPSPGAFWSGHFSFSKAGFIRDVPYDSSLYFHGEEISIAVRAWTNGYDLFYPHQTVCYHHYERDQRQTHWAEHSNWLLRDKFSQQRIRRMLGMEPMGGEVFGSYGLGTARSLDQYEEFSSVDFKNRAFGAKAWNGCFSPDPPALRSKKSPEETAGQKVLLVTAFRDINRDKWNVFQRSRRLYMEWFSTLAALCSLQLVCYCPKELQPELPSGQYILRDYDMEDTFYRTYYDSEKKIMARPDFQKWIGERIYHPEHWNPDYSMVTHCKVNFVRRAAQQYPNYSHYIWIDFGAVRYPLHPDTVFDWSRLMDDKIHMQVFGNPMDYPTNARKLCKKSPDALSAALFVVPAGKIQWYENAYEQELKRNHELNIADDEQNIMLRLAQKYPGHIAVDLVRDWQDFLYDSIC